MTIEEELQRALEIMKRSLVVDRETAEKALLKYKGNIYVVPEPLVYHISTQ